MTDTRPHLIPGPDHPITVDSHSTPVVVRVGSTVVAETTHALALQEASYPVVYYVPLSDVDGDLLSASEEHSYCPFKGEASYYDVALPDGGALPASVWYYPEPFAAVAEIEGHVAFYADRFIIETAGISN